MVVVMMVLVAAPGQQARAGLAGQASVRR